MLFNIEGKRILITGSTGGIGYVLSEGLVRAGASVIINGRTKEKVEASINKLKRQGLDVKGSIFDITDPKEVEHQIFEIEKNIGEIDVLVNNAGIQHRGALEEFNIDDWNKVINVDLTGAFIVSKAVVKNMIQRKSGKIINICSLASELARPSIAPYSAAKGGLKMLTRAMAAEWAKYNIQVNGISPGYFKTAMTKSLYENAEFDSWLCKRTPANRWGKPEELVGTLIFLSSDASSFINGQLIFVDGGITACI
jgi:gluconate 5-dehydrogenase